MIDFLVAQEVLPPGDTSVVVEALQQRLYPVPLYQALLDAHSELVELTESLILD